MVYSPLQAQTSIPGQIRLSAVSKCFTQDEFIDFYNALEMDGYRLRTEKGVPMQDKIIRESFFISLTSPHLETQNETELWENFAGTKGIVITLRPMNLTYEFRKAYYQPATGYLPILKDLMEVSQAYRRFLVFEGLAKAGFFFLPGR